MPDTNFVANSEANDLREGWRLESSVILSSLGEIPKSIIGALPPCFSQRVPNINMASNEEQRALHRSFLRRTVDSNLEVKWDASGSPILTKHPIYSSIAISHNDTLCVYVLGTKKIACDLVDIGHLSPETWKSLIPFALNKTLSAFLEESSEPYAPQGAFLWAMHGVARKLGHTVIDVMILDSDSSSTINKSAVTRQPRWVVFSASTDLGDIVVPLVQVDLLNKPMVFGFGIDQCAIDTQNEIMPTHSTTSIQERSPFQLIVKI